MKRHVLFISALAFSGCVHAQTGRPQQGGAAAAFFSWSASPFDLKVFVENKGQFAGQTGVQEKILYQAMSGGVNIYFTKTGITYRYDEVIPETKEEKAKRKKEKKERVIKVKQHCLGMQWAGCSPSAEISGEDQVSFRYTYSFDPQKQKEGIRAAAYKKITYRNLYPHIDAEYIFPEDRTGIKYSLIVRPGGDIRNIKMKWSGGEAVHDAKGNIVIKNSMGDFIDHAPLTFYQGADTETIGSAFELQDQVVTFKVSEHLRSKTIIIDPWTTNPAFQGYNSGYDVDYDFAGNVYVYGGEGNLTNPFQQIKLNSAGAIQWVFTTSVFSSSNWYTYYGDFVVDAYSGSSYVAEGMNTSPGCRILKIDPSGNQVGLFPGSDLKEIWRVAYNSCTKQGVLGGSGWDQAYEAALLDTTLASINPIHILAPAGLQDVNLLAIDNSNNCFMGFSNNGSSGNNQLLKCPAGSLLPVSYLVSNNFEAAEVQSLTYINNSSGSNAMNGIAVNGTDLYTYNGYKVKRHNKNTGAVIDSVQLTPPVYALFSSTLLIGWGGIAADDCNNIFVGSHDTVYQLDINLNKVGFIVAAGTVHDIKIGPVSTQLYVCGKNFVSCLTSGVSCNTLNASVSSSGSCAAGSATVTVTGGNAPYTYLWSNGQTTTTATGLSSGTYTVTVSDNSCPSATQTATVTLISGALTTSVSATASSCVSANGSATVSQFGGSSPYTYSWSPAGGTNATATGLSAGNYSVLVTDATGCTGTATVSVTSSNGPAVTLANLTNILCSGGNTGAASVAATGGSPPYTYNWSSGQTTSSAANLFAGNYTVTVTDANGCTQIQTVSITQPPSLTATTSATSASCGNNDGTASVTPSGGTPSYAYSWSNGNTTSQASNLTSQIYSVTITDANGCTHTATVLVTQTGGPAATTGPGVTISQGNSTTLSSSGGITYSWSPSAALSCITCMNPVASPGQTTQYCVYVFDVSGCYDSACVTVFVTTGTEPVDCSTATTGNIFLPNAFSANGDLENDVIRLYYPAMECIETFSIAIYNRWGEKIIESEDPYFTWDGTYKERPEDTGVFVYLVQVQLVSGEKLIKRGNISLMR